MKKTNLDDGCYLIEPFIQGANVKIDRKIFNEAFENSDVLADLHRIEDVFSVLARSYVEFEERLLKLSIKSEFEDFDFSNHRVHFSEFREWINLSLINLLTMSRVYEESLRSRIVGAGLPNLTKADINVLLSQEYDNKFEYRVGYGLRNFALHDTLPVASMSFSNSSEFEDESNIAASASRHRFTLNPTLSVAPLVASSRLNARVRDELKALDAEKLDIKYLVRSIVESFYRIHENVRKNSAYRFVEIDESHSKLRALLSAAKGEEARHTEIWEVEGGLVRSRKYIASELVEEISKKRARWSRLKFTARSYISNQIIKQDGKLPASDPKLWESK